jgi:hypothetical protein
MYNQMQIVKYSQQSYGGIEWETDMFWKEEEKL